MENTLQTLDVLIKNFRPEFYACLKASLKNTEILSLEEQFKRQIPDDLKAFYQWKNGQESTCYEAFINNSMFLPLGEALDIADELTSMIGTDFEAENWWNKSWIPIFHNGGGSYICYDTEGTFTGSKGQIIEFWNRDKDRNVIAANLSDFLKQLNRYYTEKPMEEWDEFFTVDHREGFPKRFTAG